MTRLFEVGGVLVGLAIILVGAVLQIAGLSAWVYCSVIGGGIVLTVVAGGIWLVQASKRRTPGALAR